MTLKALLHCCYVVRFAMATGLVERRHNLTVNSYLGGCSKCSLSVTLIYARGHLPETALKRSCLVSDEECGAFHKRRVDFP